MRNVFEHIFKYCWVFINIFFLLKIEFMQRRYKRNNIFTSIEFTREGLSILKVINIIVPHVIVDNLM